jgi:uncharacterized protein (DUF1684 family)
MAKTHYFGSSKNHKMKNILLLNCIALIFLFSCTSKKEKINKEEYLQDVNTWHEKQMLSLISDTGWLNLIGLYWLEDGWNSFGSGNQVELKLESDRFPEEIGQFELINGKVFFTPSIEGIKSKSGEIKDRTLIFDGEQGLADSISFQSLNWVIIKRSDAYGLRLRDFEAEAVKNFKGVDRFPVDIQWRIVADFVPYDPPKEIMITNIIGQTTPNPSPGYLQFEVDGAIYKIDALGSDEDEELFLIFADATSGGETYGGGRYMYVKKVNASGKIILDFNKAYNPPCVYTPHATCPLPPRQNILDLAITAGHKNYGDH